MKIAYVFDDAGWLMSELRLDQADEAANLGRPDVTELVPPDRMMVGDTQYSPRFIDGAWKLVPDTRVFTGPIL